MASSRTSSAPRPDWRWWCRSRSPSSSFVFLTFGSLRQAILVFCIVPLPPWVVSSPCGPRASSCRYRPRSASSLPDRHRRAERRGDGDLHQPGGGRGAAEFPRRRAGRRPRRRLRPVTLTAFHCRLRPGAISVRHRPGSEIQKPLAIVVIGGLFTATALTLLFLPVLYDRFASAAEERRRFRLAATPAAGELSPALQSGIRTHERRRSCRARTCCHRWSCSSSWRLHLCALSDLSIPGAVAVARALSHDVDRISR